MDFDEELKKALETLRTLEVNTYLTLENHKDCILKIVKDIKEQFFKNIEGVENKLLLSIIIEEIVSDYILNILREDFLKIVVEDLRDLKKIN